MLKFLSKQAIISMFAMGFLATPWPMGNIGFIETIL